MKPTWLFLLVVIFLSGITFLFFAYRLKPISRSFSQENASQIQPGSIITPSITFLDPRIGAADAKTVIVEFGDFLCDACQGLSEATEAIIKEDATVALVWKDMPNENSHALALSAAIAGQCANQQDKFWEYHDVLFSQQSTLTKDSFLQIARDLGLKESAFLTCMETKDPLPKIQQSIKEGLGLGITATPTIFIGSEHYVGELSKEELALRIRQTRSKNP